MYHNGTGLTGVKGGYLSSECDPKPSVEVLFTKSLSVIVNERGSTLGRTTKLRITIERSSNLSTFRQELLIRMTDEFDPFFIYNLTINEEDFQLLKSQQGLLIDFPSFPQKFIDLLELCSQEERKETPKFILNLKTSGLLGSESTVDMEIIETNPFKHLSHLSLKLLPATETFIKKYLASCLKSYKDDNERLENSLRASQAEYQNHLHHCQESLSSRNQEFERIRQTLQNEISTLSRRHAEELKDERDKVLRIQKEAEFNCDKIKKDLDERYRQEIQHLEDKFKRLETQNEELREKLSKSEANVREIRTHFVSSEDELSQLRRKNAALTKENKSLDLQYHEQLKTIGTIEAQLSSSNQEIRDKDQILIKTQELLKTTQEQKKQLEQLLDEKQALVAKRENALRTVSEDLNKGNEIIKKLQMEIRNYHNKLKIHGEVARKQEEAINEKERLIVKLENDLRTYKQLSEERESQNANLKKEINSINEKLEEITQRNKSNENVITWLNKQLNDAGLPRRGFTSTITDPAQNLSSIPFRPSALTSTPSIPATNVYPSRPPILNRPPVYPRDPTINSNGNFIYERKSTEPDPSEPPLATSSNTGVKQMGNPKSIRSSFPPQTRTFRSSSASKTPPVNKPK